MDVENIDEFFLNSLLRISIAGILLILVSNVLLSPGDVTSIYISVTILLANLVGYVLRRRYPVVDRNRHSCGVDPDGLPADGRSGWVHQLVCCIDHRIYRFDIAKGKNNVGDAFFGFPDSQYDLPYSCRG